MSNSNVKPIKIPGIRPLPDGENIRDVVSGSVLAVLETTQPLISEVTNVAHAAGPFVPFLAAGCGFIDGLHLLTKKKANENISFAYDLTLRSLGGIMALSSLAVAFNATYYFLSTHGILLSAIGSSIMLAHFAAPALLFAGFGYSIARYQEAVATATPKTRIESSLATAKILSEKIKLLSLKIATASDKGQEKEALLHEKKELLHEYKRTITTTVRDYQVNNASVGPLNATTVSELQQFESFYFSKEEVSSQPLLKPTVPSEADKKIQAAIQQDLEAKKTKALINMTAMGCMAVGITFLVLTPFLGPAGLVTLPVGLALTCLGGILKTVELGYEKILGLTENTAKNIATLSKEKQELLDHYQSPKHFTPALSAFQSEKNIQDSELLAKYRVAFLLEKPGLTQANPSITDSDELEKNYYLTLNALSSSELDTYLADKLKLAVEYSIIAHYVKNPGAAFTEIQTELATLSESAKQQLLSTALKETPLSGQPNNHNEDESEGETGPHP